MRVGGLSEKITLIRRGIAAAKLALGMIEAPFVKTRGQDRVQPSRRSEIEHETGFEQTGCSKKCIEYITIILLDYIESILEYIELADV